MRRRLLTQPPNHPPHSPMPSNKFTRRRYWPVKPHICHPPPTVPIIIPPPTVDAWMSPASQDVEEWGTASGQIYVKWPHIELGTLLTIAWNAPEWWEPEPSQIPNGEITNWSCSACQDIGPHDLGAYVSGEEVAPLYLEVEVIVVPGGD